MEKLKRAVTEIAYAQDHAKLSLLQRSSIPLLSFASSLYKVVLSLRHYLYHIGFFSKQRLPVPVISVGNLTWGGNGKTPMVEFISRCLSHSGICPLILTRGYAGGDEAKMLQRHLSGIPVKIGVGANRAAIAASFFEKYGHVGSHCSNSCSNTGVGNLLSSEKIGAVILDDGMQHCCLWRDVDIVMINALMPWGNRQLSPLGPLREPLCALRRADVAIVHHADLVLEQNLKEIVLMLREIKESLNIYFTRMAPLHFFRLENINSKIPLSTVSDAVVLCVSAIGSAHAFVKGMEKIGAFYVDRLDFTDHHLFQERDAERIKMRLGELKGKFDSNPIVIVTEKDYDRDPEILKHLGPYEVLVLCSKLQIIQHKGQAEDSFKSLLLKGILA